MREAADTIFARSAARYKCSHDCDPGSQRPPRVPGARPRRSVAHRPSTSHRAPLSTLRSLALVLSTALIGACAPELNWREVRTPEAGVQQLFPCKPVRQQRQAVVAGHARQVVLQVCDAGGVTWAQTFFMVDDASASASAAARQALVAAARANLGALADVVEGQAIGVAPSAWPPTRFDIGGRAPDGRQVAMAGLVFSRGTTVVQVSALADHLPADAVQTFFESVKALP